MALPCLRLRRRELGALAYCKTRPTRRLEARCKAWRESVNERLNLQPVAEYGVAVSWFMGLPGEEGQRRRYQCYNLHRSASENSWLLACPAKGGYLP